MSKSRKILYIGLMAFIISLLAYIIPINLQSSYAENEKVDCSNGLDFITSCPAVETEYTAGEGTVTFIPATENSPASLILNNATINANVKVNYWSLNNTYVAFAYNNDVDITLIGNNRIYLNSQHGCSGILVYDGNVNISGNGSLFIGYNGEYKRSTAYPINVMGNYDVLNNTVEGNFSDSGNLTISDCNIEINTGTNVSTACIFAHNDITINSGILKLYNNTASIKSNYSSVYINGGEIDCIGFSHNGIYARHGNVSIKGNDTKLNLTSAENANYSMGITAGNSSYVDETEAGSVYIEGGQIDIKVGLVGIYAQRLDAKENSGNIKITNGNINIEVTLSSQILAGLYSEASETDVAGTIEILGGKTVIKTEGTPTDASVGIYSAGNVVFSGGRVEISAKGTTPNTSIAVNALGDISINKYAELLLTGSDCAFNVAPTISGNFEIISATDEQGENVTSYDQSRIEEYKYISITTAIKIENVVIVEKDVTVAIGGTYQFNAKVTGMGEFDKNIIWTISGNNSLSTNINSDGLLTIASDETAKEIVVTATSSQDSSKSASITIKITEDNFDYTGIIVSIALLAVLLVILVIINLINRRKKLKRLDQ